MKKNFSNEALAIWSQILGNKGFLSSNRIQGFVDILNRELGLAPTMIRYDDKLVPCDLPVFLAWRNRDYPDDHCTVYYHPDACAEATGSGAHNWLQWSSLLLNYGRKTHKLAPRMKPSAEVAAAMGADSPKTTRFLTLELVIFYLAAQTRTWGRPHRIITVKDLIAKNDVTTLSFLPPTAEPIDVGGLFPTAPTKPEPELPKTRVPKAGISLVAYNPGQAAKTPAVRQPVNAPISGAAVDISSPTVSLMAVDTTKLDDAGLEAHIAALQAALLERRTRAMKAQFSEEAAKAIIIHGDSMVWPDRAEYATMTVRYGNGDEVTYFHQKLMETKVEDNTWARNDTPDVLIYTDHTGLDIEVGDLLGGFSDD